MPTGHVRLSAPVGTAPLLWSVSSLMALYPQVRAEVEFTDRHVDLVAERFDLALRSGPQGRFGDLIGRLVEAPRMLVASPAYLQAHGTRARSTSSSTTPA